MTEEVVWTSRRAFLHAEGRSWAAGRLRLTDRTVRFTTLDGDATEVPLADLAAVRLLRLPRRALLLETPAGPLRLRCFAMPAIAALLTFHGSGRLSDTP